MDSETTDRAATDAARFLDALYPAGLPEGARLLTWTLSSKSSAWWTDLEKAAFGVSARDDIYIGCGLAPEGLGPRERCLASKVVGIPGLWLDVDIRDGEAHKAENLPTTEAEASSVFVVPPTVVVHSGYGLQAWWLFPETWTFADAADRKRAERLLVAWHGATNHRAGKKGWKVDATHDLARVLRIPSTFNAKNGKRVPVVLRKDDGPRYDLDQLEDLSAAFSVAASASPESRNGSNGKHYGGEPTDWGKIEEGVGEGERNSTAAKYIGLIVRGITDITDNRLIRAARFGIEAWNKNNTPPLDDDELKKVFNSILKKEREKRADDDFDDALGAFVPAGTEPKAPPKETGDPETPPTPAGPLDNWRCVTILSEPKTYRLHSPLWPKPLVLNSDQMISPHHICREALEQAGVAVPVRRFGALWNGTKGQKGFFARVVEATEIERAPPEIVRTNYVASILHTYLVNAGPSSGDDASDKKRVALGESPTRLDDGSVAFHFNHLLRSMMDKPNRPSNNELSGVFQKAGIRSVRPRIGGSRVSFCLASPDALKRLEDVAAGGSDHDAVDDAGDGS